MLSFSAICVREPHFYEPEVFVPSQRSSIFAAIIFVYRVEPPNGILDVSFASNGSPSEFHGTLTYTPEVVFPLLFYLWGPRHYTPNERPARNAVNVSIISFFQWMLGRVRSSMGNIILNGNDSKKMRESLSANDWINRELKHLFRIAELEVPTSKLSPKKSLHLMSLLS